jgi:hypothetical protein
METARAGKRIPIEELPEIDRRRNKAPKSEKSAETRPRFIACCAMPHADGKRIFLFHSDGSERLLSDDEVSWYYQRELSDLTKAELAKDKRFREGKRTFPTKRAQAKSGHR